MYPEKHKLINYNEFIVLYGSKRKKIFKMDGFLHDYRSWGTFMRKIIVLGSISATALLILIIFNPVANIQATRSAVLLKEKTTLFTIESIIQHLGNDDSFVSLISTKTEKRMFIQNILLTKIKTIHDHATTGIIGGAITILGVILIAFFIWLYVGLATGNDVVLHVIVKLISAGVTILQYIFAFMIGYLIASARGALPPFLKMLEPILVPAILGLLYILLYIYHILNPDVII